jgi:myo-inositol-1(or 4)-monophosphatase
MNHSKDLAKIERALLQARQAVARFTPGQIESQRKAGGDPVTEADTLLDQVLKEELLAPGEGWLSEETADDPGRLEKERVWIVDPIDGTREFIQGIPEWCISVGLAINGSPVCGGICNPAADRLFLGCVGEGVILNGRSVRISEKRELEGARVLASRSEVKRGEWRRFENAPFEIVPMGSVAYKLACVAAGLADATFTLVPKNEWDVAAGAALIRAAGGRTADPNSKDRVFNKQNPLLTLGFAAANKDLVRILLEQVISKTAPH